jgi:hypothetical protein
LGSEPVGTSTGLLEEITPLGVLVIVARLGLGVPPPTTLTLGCGPGATSPVVGPGNKTGAFDVVVEIVGSLLGASKIVVCADPGPGWLTIWFPLGVDVPRLLRTEGEETGAPRIGDTDAIVVGIGAIWLTIIWPFVGDMLLLLPFVAAPIPMD